MVKVLKIKTGEVYIDGKTYSVFQDAWEKESKDGKTNYYEIRSPVFVNTVDKKPEVKEVLQA